MKRGHIRMCPRFVYIGFMAMRLFLTPDVPTVIFLREGL